MISTLYANRILDVLFRGSGYPGGTVYLALHTEDPRDDGRGEIRGGGFFERPNLDWHSWEDAVGGVIATAAPIALGSLHAATATHFALWNHRRVGLGKVLHSGLLAESLEILEGNGVTFAAGAIQVTLGPCVDAPTTQVSDYAANKILTYIFRGGIHNDYSRNFAPAPVSLSLHTSDPGITGANEVSGRSYGRHPVPREYWTGPVGRSIALAKDLDWQDVPTSTITHVGIWDRLGNFLMAVELPNPVIWLARYTARLGAGQLRITLGCAVCVQGWWPSNPAAPLSGERAFPIDAINVAGLVDQYVEVVIGTVCGPGSYEGFGLVLRYTGATYYHVFFAEGVSPLSYFQMSALGAGGSDLAYGDITPLQSGDVVRFSAIQEGGSARVQALVNGDVIATSLIAPADPQYFAAGRFGIRQNDGAGEEGGPYLLIDSFRGGIPAGATFVDEFNRPDADTFGPDWELVGTDALFSIREQCP